MADRSLYEQKSSRRWDIRHPDSTSNFWTVQKLLVESGCRMSQRRDDFCSYSERSAMAVRLQFAAKDGPEPHRPACRQACADAPQDACNEPGGAGCRTRPQLPAGTEIREGHEPHRGEPVAANVPYLAGAGRVLLRGRAERISATGLRKSVIDGRD